VFAAAALGVLCTLTATPPDFSVSSYTYFRPGSAPYVQPNLALDEDWLHVEARYNYEGLNTGSVWAGVNVSGGKTLKWSFTPMLGGVFGETRGVAPGFELQLAWWKLDLSSQSELVLDVGEIRNSFLYTWSELGFAPVGTLRLGGALQRTHVHAEHLQVEPGLFAGFRAWGLALTTYAFDLEQRHPTVVFMIGVSSPEE
jgi:hypothetical protein